MAGLERIRDSDQAGWNAGYIAGEQERAALAQANVELRGVIRELRDRIAMLTAETVL